MPQTRAMSVALLDQGDSVPARGSTYWATVPVGGAVVTPGSSCSITSQSAGREALTR